MEPQKAPRHSQDFSSKNYLRRSPRNPAKRTRTQYTAWWICLNVWTSGAEERYRFGSASSIVSCCFPCCELSQKFLQREVCCERPFLWDTSTHTMAFLIVSAAGASVCVSQTRPCRDSPSQPRRQQPQFCWIQTPIPSFLIGISWLHVHLCWFISPFEYRLCGGSCGFVT